MEHVLTKERHANVGIITMDWSILNVIYILSFLFITFNVIIPFVKYVATNFKKNISMSSIPSPPSQFLLGHLQLFTSHDKPVSYIIFDLIKRLSEQFAKEGIFRMRFVIQSVVYLSTPDTIEAVLSKSNLIDKEGDYLILAKWLGNGLLTSTGSKWKNRRKLLTPTFHFKILEDFIPVMNEQSVILCEKLSVKSDDEDVSRYITSATLDIIMETAMGVKLNAQSNYESIPYVKTIKDFSQLFLIRSITPWMWINFLFDPSPTGRRFHKIIARLHEFTNNTISKRKQVLLERKSSEPAELNANEGSMSNEPGKGFNEKKRRLAFLDLLLKYHFEDPVNFDENAIREEVDTFTFGGHDTTGISLTYIFLLIGHHPEVQQKIHRELDDIFAYDKDRDVTQDDLNKMEYLTMVIKESLRMYSPAPMIMRTLPEEVEIRGHKIPAGTEVIINFLGLHYNETEYPNPEVFDPERFNISNSINRHPFAFCPFSGGPRSCIGQKFAMMEEKIVVSNVLRRFTLQSLTPLESLDVSMEIVLRPVPPVKIRFTSRN